MGFLHNFWLIVVESAPWLLIGYLLAGIINELIPSRWVQKQLSGRNPITVIKGALIGAPLPLCSCGVIPAAVAIRKAGASKGASASFLVATPETGVDSVAFSYAVLGPVYAIARPIAAIGSAIVTGLLVNVVDKQDGPSLEEPKSCCASGCADKKQEKSLSQKIRAAFNYGYNNMIDDTAGWLLIGFIAAAMITTWVPQSFFMQWGTGIGAMLIMVLIGLPMYICATASTPIAASFLFAGISPGAALVFLLTGPATNVATMGIIKQHLGTRSLFAYLVGVVGSAIFCGLLLNYLVEANGWSFNALAYEEHEHFAWWRHAAAIVLSLVVLRVFVKDLLVYVLKLTATKSTQTKTDHCCSTESKTQSH